MTVYYICDKPSPEYRTLCGDGQFCKGYYCIGNQSDTLLYKRKSAALKRLNSLAPFKKINREWYPHACLLVIEERINYFIDRGGKPVSIRP